MADTSVQWQVEEWLRSHPLQEDFGQPFTRRPLALTSGGSHSFDAVSADGKTVGVIATSGSKTAGGKHATGKMHKIRSDMYFLLLASAERRMVLFTQPDMYAYWQKERGRGRVPSTIEFVLMEIPADLQIRLSKAQKEASDEMSPQ